jgi:long-chain acyl-CoA synthetase
MNIGTLIPRHARYRPNHTAIVFGGERLSYSGFSKRVNRLGRTLASAGIGKDQKIATVVPNCQEQLDLYWAAAETGAVVVPMSPLLQPKGLAGLLRDDDAEMVLTHPNYVALVSAARADLDIPAENYIIAGDKSEPGYRSYADFTAGHSDAALLDAGLTDNDVYNITYSSGTTGDPKGIVHGH